MSGAHDQAHPAVVALQLLRLEVAGPARSVARHHHGGHSDGRGRREIDEALRNVGSRTGDAIHENRRQTARGGLVLRHAADGSEERDDDETASQTDHGSQSGGSKADA